MPLGQKAALSDNSVVLWGFFSTANASLTKTNFFNFESPRKPGQPKFKTELSSRLMNIGASRARITRCLEPKDDAQVGFTGPHGPQPTKQRNKISWFCRECWPSYPLYSSETGRVCFEMHKVHGIPQKRYFRTLSKLKRLLLIFAHYLSFSNYLYNLRSKAFTTLLISKIER